jgi:hypothetical protein
MIRIVHLHLIAQLGQIPVEKILLCVLLATIVGTSRYPGQTPFQTHGTSEITTFRPAFSSNVSYLGSVVACPFSFIVGER